MSIHIESLGEENSPTLLMIHGAGGSVNTWFLQLKNLSPKLHTMAVDLNGHGDSKDRDESPIVDSYLDDIQEVCSQIEKPFLMGHSMGGALIQLYALSNPKSLSGIILVGTGAKLRVHPMIFNLLDNNFDAYVEALEGYMFHEGTNPKLIEASRIEVRKCSPTIIKRDFKLCNEFDIMDRVQEIAIPTLIIVGKDDIMTPIKYAQYLHDKISNSDLRMVENAGHSVMLEQSKEFNRLVLEWIQNKSS
jgi:pimeloyl-ACP methyl ester carboxylesterase